MANQDEASASNSQVPIISSIKISNVEYKMLIEKLTSEMFNVHTSMTIANEEIQKLSTGNSKLIERNEHLELSLLNNEALKQEVEYFKNKIVCADQFEKVLREKIAENELKIKAYQNSSVLESAYHDKNQENCKLGIGFDYEALKDKRTSSHKSKNFSNEKGPQILKNVSNPILKRTIIDFDEELFVIKQQLLDEYNQEKCGSSSPVDKEKVKASTNAGSSENEKLKVKKKKANRNGKVGINTN